MQYFDGGGWVGGMGPSSQKVKWFWMTHAPRHDDNQAKWQRSPIRIEKVSIYYIFKLNNILSNIWFLGMDGRVRRINLTEYAQAYYLCMPIGLSGSNLNWSCCWRYVYRGYTIRVTCRMVCGTREELGLFT